MLCAHGFDGYISGPIGTFHPEIFLCTWRNNLVLDSVYKANNVLRSDFSSDFYMARAKNIAINVWTK